MRLIDADELKHSITQTVDILEKTEDDIVTLIVLRAMAETFLEVIDKAPILSVLSVTFPAKAKGHDIIEADYDAIEVEFLKGRRNGQADVLKEIKGE